MNKNELIAALADKTAFSKKDAEKTLNAFMDSISESLAKGEKIQLIGFGTFSVKERVKGHQKIARTPKRYIVYLFMQGWQSNRFWHF